MLLTGLPASPLLTWGPFFKQQPGLCFKHRHQNMRVLCLAPGSERKSASVQWPPGPPWLVPQVTPLHCTMVTVPATLHSYCSLNTSCTAHSLCLDCCFLCKSTIASLISLGSVLECHLLTETSPTHFIYKCSPGTLLLCPVINFFQKAYHFLIYDTVS